MTPSAREVSLWRQEEEVVHDGDGVGDNADVDANGNGYLDCVEGTTEVSDGMCLLPTQIDSDLKLTFTDDSNYANPDYLINGWTYVGNTGFIEDQEELDELQQSLLSHQLFIPLLVHLEQVLVVKDLQQTV